MTLGVYQPYTVLQCCTTRTLAPFLLPSASRSLPLRFGRFVLTQHAPFRCADPTPLDFLSEHTATTMWSDCDRLLSGRARDRKRGHVSHGAAKARCPTHDVSSASALLWPAPAPACTAAAHTPARPARPTGARALGPHPGAVHMPPRRRRRSPCRRRRRSRRCRMLSRATTLST